MSRFLSLMAIGCLLAATLGCGSRAHLAQSETPQLVQNFEEFTEQALAVRSDAAKRVAFYQEHAGKQVHWTLVVDHVFDDFYSMCSQTEDTDHPRCIVCVIARQHDLTIPVGARVEVAGLLSAQTGGGPVVAQLQHCDLQVIALPANTEDASFDDELPDPITPAVYEGADVEIVPVTGGGFGRGPVLRDRFGRPFTFNRFGQPVPLFQGPPFFRGPTFRGPVFGIPRGPVFGIPRPFSFF